MVSETAEDARTVHSQLKHFSSRDVNIIARDLGLFLDLVKAFDMLVPRELLWNTLERFGVPLKLIPVLRAMHKSIEVLFEVGPWWNQTLTLLNHRGQTRRLIRTRTLYYIHGGSDGDLGRSGHDYEYCTLRTREDFVLTGGIQTPQVVRMSSGSNTPNLQSPTVNMPMTKLYRSAIEQMLKSTRRYTHGTFSSLRSGGSCMILPPFQGFKVRIAILCSPSLNVPRPKHV